MSAAGGPLPVLPAAARGPSLASAFRAALAVLRALDFEPESCAELAAVKEPLLASVNCAALAVLRALDFEPESCAELAVAREPFLASAF